MKLTDLSAEIIDSRRLLVDVLRALQPQRESLTVVGAHAVMERTRELDDRIEPDSTRDADIGVTPSLLLGSPVLAEVMASLGLEPASIARPGVWGPIAEAELPLHARRTIDLLAPASVAGAGRRSAAVGAHGARSVSKTAGTELTLFDRTLETVTAFDHGGAGESGEVFDSVEAYVAGSAALLCAKAYKLHDRADPTALERNADRLRPKDAGDIWRLMATSDPSAVRVEFARGESRADIGPAVELGRLRLEEITGRRRLVQSLAIAHFGGLIARDEVEQTVEDWMADFGR